MKLRAHIVYRIAIVAVAAVASWLAYGIGKSSSDARLQQLGEEVSRLEEMQREADIVKSVSRQMEQIAYQQKEISDEQRKLAVEKSREAETNALRAESESRQAREAEAEAMQQKDIAEQQRLEADEQRQEAVRANARTQQALKQSQNLTYRRIGNQMATTVQTQLTGNAQDVQLSMLLSYWSYTFLSRHDGNTYFADTYKSLSRFSGTERTFTTPSRGALTALAFGRRGCVIGVTNYGEVISVSGETVTTLLDHDARDLDFRGVAAGESGIVLLTSDGQLMKMDYDGRLTDQRSLIGAAAKRSGSAGAHGEVFGSMLRMKDGTLMAASNASLFIVDGMTLEVTRRIPVEGGVSCMYPRGDLMCVHTGHRKYMEVNARGEAARPERTIKNIVVTAGCHDEQTGLTMLGYKDGQTDVVNRYGRRITEIPGNGSRITSILIQDTISLISTYDHVVQICNMPKFKMESGHFFREDMELRTQPQTSGNGPVEWITPVSLEQEGWPLCMLVDGRRKEFYIGTSRGQLHRRMLSVDKLAARVRERIRRNLTQTEWERFVGDRRDVPYEVIK